MMASGCLLGRPWGRGAVLMRFSVAGLWGSGGDGALMTFFNMSSKWDDSEWRPGSIFMVGERALMKTASLMPCLTQSASRDRIETSFLQKWWPLVRACWSMADLYLP